MIQERTVPQLPIIIREVVVIPGDTGEASKVEVGHILRLNMMQMMHATRRRALRILLQSAAH